MDDSADVSTLSYMDVLLRDLDKSLEGGVGAGGKPAGGGEEDGCDPVPDSTTSLLEKSLPQPPPVARHSFCCGDDVLVPNKDGRYYLGTIVELSTDEAAYDGEPGCLIKFGDGTHSWSAAGALKLLTAPAPDDGRAMCVVCKRREGDAVIACDKCGRGYHAECHTPVVDSWITGASWNCRRCVDQRYRVAAAENRAQKRAELVRLKGGAHRRPQLPMFTQQPCDTASTTSSTASDHGKDESHCYCGEKSDFLAQMLMCCRCKRWFHQRCVSSLQYPLYAGDKLYIFACATCNGGSEYLRRLELRWLDLAHLALYNLTAYNARNYFDLDAVIMPYILDNWHALQLPQKMWSTSSEERRERVLTALTGSRARFKCGREMKKRATIWGLRVRRAPPHSVHLKALAEAKENELLTDEVVARLAPRLRFLPRTRSVSPPPTPPPHTPLTHHVRDSSQPTSSNNGNSSYASHNQNMIVPVDGHWLNLMMGKRFNQNLSSPSENDSPCSSPSPTEFMNNTLINAHSVNFGLRYDMLKPSEPALSPYRFEDEIDENIQRNKYTKKKQLKLYKMDYFNGGLVKKSIPFSNQSASRKKKFASSDEKKRKDCKSKDVEVKSESKKLLRNSYKEKTNRETTPLRSSSKGQRNSPPDKDRSPSADPEIILKGDCSTSSYDSMKPLESEAPSDPPLPSSTLSSAQQVSAATSEQKLEPAEDASAERETPKRKLSTVSNLSDSLMPCSVQIDKLSNNKDSNDAPKTPININGVFAGAHTSKIATMNLEISKLSTKNIIEHSKIMSLQQRNGAELWRGVGRACRDESSGDETSSRGTLDAIIPPLKNFQGKNNPFLMQHTAKKSSFSMASKLLNSALKKNGLKGRHSLPAQLAPLPPGRPLKRQLSEKDLIIGPNGEVKRRKHRRPRKNGQLNQSCPLPGDRTNASQTYPSRAEEAQKKKDFNGRRLRQRQEKNYFENGRRGAGGGGSAVVAGGAAPSSGVDTLQLSPHKVEPPQRLAELKSSVRSYFGAATRVRAGAGFTVAARRVSGCGDPQYLIEWASS